MIPDDDLVSHASDALGVGRSALADPATTPAERAIIGLLGALLVVNVEVAERAGVIGGGS